MWNIFRRRRDRRRVFTMPPEFAEVYAPLAQEFEAKFGRPPGPGDPLIFDPNADTPQPMSVAKIEGMFVEFFEKQGADQATLYAIQQTGMVPPMAGHGYSDADVAEFEEARERYLRLHGPS